MNLRKGDTIGIISLAGDCNKEDVLIAKVNLEALGYKVRLSDNIYDKNRYLAGSDNVKVSELQKFFTDPEIKLILNARGGYGSIRLINKIDYEIVKNNPKPFCGHSDITTLLLMFYKKCNILTFHAPMLLSDFVSPVESTVNNFFEAINNCEFHYDLTVHNKGDADGILWGGNLSTVVSLCGQDFVPDKDFVFFCEDLNEPVYKIDKMFNQLFNMDNFAKRCKAIILGDFLGLDNENWFKELVCEFKVPIFCEKKITHAPQKITLPIGAYCKIEDSSLIIKK